jgi:hypothetical protein
VVFFSPVQSVNSSVYSVVKKNPKARCFGVRIVRCAENATFFHPDYTVGSGITPDHAFAENSAPARGLAGIMAGLPPIGNWASVQPSPGPEGD